MNKLDFYKESYYKEFEKKTSLENSLNFPFGIVSAFLGLWFYFLSNYDFKSDGACNYLFIISMSISVFSIVIAVIYLLTSYHHLRVKYSYGYLPEASKIDAYNKTLVEWHINNGSNVVSAEIEFEDYLVSKFIEAKDIDFKMNEKKIGFLHRGKAFLFYSILLLLVTSFLCGFNSYHKKINKENIYKVEIVSPK